MDHGSTFEHVVDALVGLPLDVAEHLMDALHSSLIELGNIDHEDVVKVLTAAVTASAGAATRHYLTQHRQELETAIKRSLVAG
jgi:hypothetical protein